MNMPPAQPPLTPAPFPLKSESMIEMQGIVKTFKTPAGEFTALKSVDLTIWRGEFVSIIGKSGSGKSTLLNMITGIDHPTQGRVVIGGTDIYTGVTESQRSRWRGRNLGIVFQFFQLLPMLTLLENVMLAMDFAEMYDFEERPARALELLKLVGLEKFANKLPVLVSTGQQQLAAIAVHLPVTRRYWSRMSQPVTLIRNQPTQSWICSRSCHAVTRLSSWSRMTRR
jgi:putative ABC transport system ATP-binding protein